MTCANCQFAGRPTYKSPCSECNGYSKHEAVEIRASEIRTNGDQVRAMSDEELGQMLFAVKLGYAPWCDHSCECATCISNWFKQPVEEVNRDAE